MFVSCASTLFSPCQLDYFSNTCGSEQCGKYIIINSNKHSANKLRKEVFSCVLKTLITLEKRELQQELIDCTIHRRQQMWNE